MDRNALLIYVRELRDLEIAHRNLQDMMIKEKEKYQNRYDELNSITTYRLPEKIRPVSGIGLFFIFAGLMFLGDQSMMEKLNG